MKPASPLYVFGDNSFCTPGFTRATAIRPRSEMAGGVCRKCGTVHAYPSGAFDVVVEGGVKYPDALLCAPYPFLVVSEAVIAAWRLARITSFHTFPVGIAEVRSRELGRVEPPRYFRVEVDGRCRIDIAARGARIVRFCPHCRYLVTQPPLVPGFRMVPGSWDGSALFRDPDLYPLVNFCSPAVLAVASQYRPTNFRFEPMEGPFDFSRKGIDYAHADRWAVPMGAARYSSSRDVVADGARVAAHADPEGRRPAPSPHLMRAR